MLMSLNHIVVYICNSFGLVSVKGITVVLVCFRKSPLEFLQKLGIISSVLLGLYEILIYICSELQEKKELSTHAWSI